MRNELMLNNLITRYNRVAYTHNYIFGYTDHGNVYVSFAKSDIMPYVCCVDKASRGYGLALRFKPTKAQKELLKMQKTFVLCSEKYFNEQVAESDYNKGEIFEKLVTEYFGQSWAKDNVPFTKAGDLEANGTSYQIKFQSATFCNEKSIASLERFALIEKLGL